MSGSLEIVEPTLVGEAGHCAALFSSLQRAAPFLPYRLWVDRRAQLPQIAGSGVALRPYFHRRWRKLQALWLYRRLLRGDAPILVPTATWFDLRAMDLVSGGRIEPLRAFLYFHKWRNSPARDAALQRLALRQPALHLFGTSEAIVAHLRRAGFEQVRQVIPILGEVAPAAKPAGFRCLLSAGAARGDKGFAHVVDLVELLQARASTLPIVVQASGDHYGRHDPRTREDLQRLRHLDYAPLTVLEQTLTAREYADLFDGGICLQPYEPEHYADKMSAVTFDALRAGAPIVTVAGTSMAAIVGATGAGIVVERPTAEALLRACQAILGDYAHFCERALAAGAGHSTSAAWRALVEPLEQACAAVRCRHPNAVDRAPGDR